MPRSRRRRVAPSYRLVVVLAVVLVLGLAGYAASDVYRDAAQPAVSAPPVARPTSAQAADPRRQVRVRTIISSDAAFSYGYRDLTTGREQEGTSDDGSDVVIEEVLRAPGPYVQVGAQASITGTFIRCEVEVDGERVTEETVRGAAEATYCAG